ncbi:MAG: hypothetical protein ACYDAQ_12140 [Mycobacteriales bacterium]
MERVRVHPSVLGHYTTGVERARLSTLAHNQLEGLRTHAVLTSVLPDGGDIYDIGGGP